MCPVVERQGAQSDVERRQVFAAGSNGMRWGDEEMEGEGKEVSEQ